MKNVLDNLNTETYYKLYLSGLLEDPEKYLQQKVSCRITLDIDLTYEEATYIKDLFTDIFKLREFALLPSQELGENIGDSGEIEFRSVDQIVIQELNAIDSATYDTNILIAIYNSL